jgi:glucose/mannose transport system permease protein
MTPRRHIPNILTALAIWVPLALCIGQVVGFTFYTLWISFTPSTLVPDYGFVGLRNYSAMLATRNWKTAADNLVIYSTCFMVVTTALGLLLAVLIDQKLRGETVLRAIFLYPMAVSFVVTGVVWSWLLNPGLGIQKLVNEVGWTNFRFDWLIDGNRAIYTIVMAGAWQASGFAMALLLAGLRSVDGDLMKAAQIDGAGPLRTYRRIILPSIWPIFVAVFVVLLQFAIKTFDLAMALTGGGPGIATMLPSIVVYDFMFQRGYLGRGSAAAVMMLVYLLAVLVPYGLFRQWLSRRQARLENTS